MPKRPKSDGRCVHCRRALAKRTKDHAFPDSWYPASTPTKVQRWTVPSCPKCNHDFGEMENEVFVPLALCVDPRKIAAAGMSQKALRALGIGANRKLDEKEKQKRRAVMAKVFRDAKPYSPEVQPHVLPGLGPHPDAPAEQQLQILVSGDKLKQVLAKVVRACEYWLGNGRIIEPPYELEIIFTHDDNVPRVARIFGGLGRVYLGPGFRVQRASANDEPWAVLYKIVIWDSLTFYGSILPVEEPAAGLG